ncbi:MAG: hypothetical protein HY548_05845 [Elusimicrobia bacterium]|nr:hypothetical protein [Elusimicrobiota bacterium]
MRWAALLLGGVAAFGLRDRAWGQEEPFAAQNVAHALSGWRWGGALSLNYRNIGAKPIEIEIENQVQLTDIFFRVTGPVMKDTPFLVEFALDPNGHMALYRLAVKSLNLRRVEMEFGRFLVPFGRINELYRPDLYPLITKPLLYASPGLDFVSRVSYPHPQFSSGYVDTGVRATYTPHAEPVWFPRRLTLFMVNGLQESPIRGRRPPDSRTFNILDSVNGTDLDWGHEVNNLSDNNDTKNPGLRVNWDYGDVAYPSPFSRAAFVNGVSFGLSGMIGKYDIEDRLSNWVWGADLGLRRAEYRLTAEFISGQVQAKWPKFGTTTSTAAATSPSLAKDRYITSGYTLQLEFPFPEFPLSEQTIAIFRVESMQRRGPALNRNGEVLDGLPIIESQVHKYSGGFNSRMNPFFSIKLEYGHWTFGSDYRRIYQVLIAGVMSF